MGSPVSASSAVTTLAPDFPRDSVPNSSDPPHVVGSPPDPEFDWLIAPLAQALGAQADTPVMQAAIMASEGRFRQMAGRVDLSVHTRAQQEARRNVEDLGRIARLQQEMASLELDLPTLIVEVVQRTQELLGADGCSLEMLQEDGELVVHAGSGLMENFVGRHSDLKTSLSGKALAQRCVLLCDDTEQDDRVDRTAARLIKVRSLITAPLRSGENAECGAGPITFTDFADGLTAHFQQGRLVGWTWHAPQDGDGPATGSVKLPGTVQVGSARAVIEAEPGFSKVEGSTLGEEFALGSNIGGFIKGDVVEMLYAGTQCFFR